MGQLYSVACEHVGLFHIRVEASTEDEARYLAKRQLAEQGIVIETMVPGYVGHMTRAGTVLLVEE